ncbi:MAG TPA: sugar phosphate isomerase/epimerase [Candidatus Faecaligallichristensenella faecipullorum]|nr:sugar phosphate isomerase/epimerase [Candidatus Faecaligallichristensenella faecipullorum]
MNRIIPVGTCIPGERFTQWVPALMGKGFECFSINFHMEFHGIELEKFSDKVRAIMEGGQEYVASLGYYCNALQFEEHRKSLEKCIDLAHTFGTNLVTTFAGGLEGRSVEESMPKFKEVFGELCKRAEDKGVKICIENCPMDGTWKHVTCNIGFNPRAWEMMFNEVSSPALGLEWEPAHQMGQLIDPIANLRKFAPKVYHMHGKDANVKRDLIASEGIIGAQAPVDMRFPGLGEVDWREVFTILYQNGYDSDICIEGYHDLLFNGEFEMTGQLHALNYLKWCRGGSFAPNPWGK